MAELPEDLIDSRTSIAGRKRALENLIESNEDVAFDDTFEGESLERSRKRVKEDNELSAVSSPDVGLIIDTISPFRVDPPQVEAVPTQSAPPMTWNAGVQSGLRTSFGARASSSLQPSQRKAESGGLGESVIPSLAELNVLEDSNALSTAHSSNYVSESGSTPASQTPALQEASRYYSNNFESEVAAVDQPTNLYSPSMPDIAARSQIHKDGVPATNDASPAIVLPGYTGTAAPGSSRIFLRKEISAFNVMSNEDRATLPPEERLALQLASEERSQKKKYRKKDRKKVYSYEKRLRQQDEISEDDEVDGSAAELSLPTRPLVRPPGMAPFKQLTHSELGALSTTDRKTYDAARRLENVEQRQDRMAKNTAQIEQLLSNQGWPIPGNNSLRREVKNGLTYFPRDCPKHGLKYSFKNEQFTMREVLIEGMPIKVQNFSFNIFALAFLTENQDMWNILTQKLLIGAFSHYVNIVYSHILPLADWLLPTAEAPDALTLLDAKREVTRIMETVPRKIVPMMSPLPGAFLIAASQANSLDPNLPVGKMAQGFPNFDKRLPVVSRRSNESAGEVREEGYQMAGVELSNSAQRVENHGDVTMLDSERPGTSNSGSTNVSTPVNAEMLVDTELHLRQKYFPSTNDNLVVRRCLACTSIIHSTWDCPTLTCGFCGDSADHSSSACPRQQRCGKCRERGHATTECPEKLSRAKPEAVPCDLCGSTNHVESKCHMIWRSFVPKPEEVTTVRDVPIHCYSCGGSEHYGPECGIHQGVPLSGAVTWSKANLLRYVDPNSQHRAISAGVDYTIHSRPKRSFFIKGKANDPITLDSSDDEGQDFIRPKVNPPTTQHGRIEFGDSSRSAAQLPSRAHHQIPRASRPTFDQDSRTAEPVRNQPAPWERERTYSPPTQHRGNNYIRNANNRAITGPSNRGSPARGKGHGGRGASRGGPQKPRGNKSGKRNAPKTMT